MKSSHMVRSAKIHRKHKLYHFNPLPQETVGL